jgi:nucleoside-triphosphatase THEP1
VLRLVLEEHVNVQITGEPGAGKTEVASALMVTLQAAGVDFMLVSLSNMITSFLRKRHKRNGLQDVENVIGTFSSKLWASLGSDFSFDRVEEMADEIMTAPYTKSVLQRIRKTQVLLIEEEQNTVPSFKDVLFAVISKVCGCEGPEPAGNKQIVTIGDERQLGGIPVQDGTPGQGTEGLRVGGALVPGGQPLQTLAFESQCLQAFYPEQAVCILGEHFASLGGAREARPGTVVRFCLMRDKFLVRCKGAAELGTRGFGSSAPVRVEYVAEAHLRAATSRAANFVSVHLLGSKRVRNGTYADGLPVAQQTAEALGHRAITELHHGITDSDAVRELFARLQDVGRRLFVERPQRARTRRLAVRGHQGRPGAHLRRGRLPRRLARHVARDAARRGREDAEELRGGRRCHSRGLRARACRFGRRHARTTCDPCARLEHPQEEQRPLRTSGHQRPPRWAPGAGRGQLQERNIGGRERANTLLP